MTPNEKIEKCTQALYLHYGIDPDDLSQVWRDYYASGVGVVLAKSAEIDAEEKNGQRRTAPNVLNVRRKIWI